MTIISSIKLFQSFDDRYYVKIDHDGRVVKSGVYKNACDAYADAESKLVYKPGYVMAVPIEER